jgi:hypothetical protein
MATLVSLDATGAAIQRKGNDMNEMDILIAFKEKDKVPVAIPLTSIVYSEQIAAGGSIRLHLHSGYTVVICGQGPHASRLLEGCLPSFVFELLTNPHEFATND